MGNLCTFLSICCELKTTVKNKVYLLKLLYITYKIHVFLLHRSVILGASTKLYSVLCLNLPRLQEHCLYKGLSNLCLNDNFPPSQFCAV